MSVPPLIHPTSVAVVDGYRLRLQFEDGLEGEIDFSDYSRNGVFAPFADVDFFQQVKMDHETKTISWPNGADIAPETLHLWALKGQHPYPDRQP